MSSKTPQTRLQGRPKTARSSDSEMPKKLVIMNVSLGITLFVVVSFVCFKYHNKFFHLPTRSTIQDRLIYTLQMQAFCMIPILLGTLNVIFYRVTTGTVNPLSGQEHNVEKPVRILTNTVEQTVVHVFSLIILATYVHHDYLFLIPTYVSCWVVGRILFIIGYTIHPKFRGVGFSMGLSSTMIVFGLNLAYALGLNRMIYHAATGSSSTKSEL